ncbi:GNAT family N-acetyltransferase [Segetibacter sp. 3557_3]|uniref:GNAT family N-acetyltransferase n=1 Tax=Segetibacter sp. 3557_3 TaxID=2547429 RepID=UPI001058F781|nr:GNAT family N-acetyltransferase [Segetibacter sp. 3557_3]TDH19972.1 GNAT family N-acetyltransferase [Segetibacter sp. 3557_3]
MTNVVIRYASEKDCHALSTAMTTVIQNIPYYNELAKQEEILKYQPPQLQVKIREDELSIIIATVDNKIVGFCLSRFDDYLIWLEWVGIVEDYRAKGISHLLLNELDQTIEQRKCHKIWCDCRTENSASIHLLYAHGYTQLVTIPNHWYKQDFIIWQKVV